MNLIVYGHGMALTSIERIDVYVSIGASTCGSVCDFVLELREEGILDINVHPAHTCAYIHHRLPY